MSIEKLKEKARRHEQNEEWKKALDQYNLALAELAREEQVDIGLYNRVGDLYVRTGELDSAVEHYDKAVDLYREAYLPNNAIAVCKKIIRNVPERHRAYLVIGQIRAEQGFLPDARTNFLTYAERMQQAGQLDESFRALIEFCDLAPDDVGVRVTVAEQMSASGRTEEAVEQLIIARQHFIRGGDQAQADETEAKILELDPNADLSAVPEMAGFGSEVAAGGEVMAEFGDISFGDDEAPEEAPEVPSDLMEAAEDFVAQAAAEEAAEEAAGEFLIEPEPAAAEASFDDDGAGADPAEDAEGAVELPTMDFDSDDAEGAVELPTMDFDSDDAEGAVELPTMDFDSDDVEGAVELPTMDFDADDAEGAVELPTMDFDDGNPAAAEAAPEPAGVEIPEIDFAEEADATPEPAAVEEVELEAPSDPAKAMEEAVAEMAAAPEPPPPPTPAPEPVVEPPVAEPPPAQPPAAAQAPADEGFVDLGAMILGTTEEKSTRFTVAYQEPTGDEEADFARMLSQFKEKVTENLDSSDVRAHYDLGTAYKEMGLLDEAISSFQAALRASADHLPTYELMGQTFMEMGQPDAAVRSLQRALEVNASVEDELVGIYYYLARAHEELGDKSSALEYYDRVFALDINFADVTERLRGLR